MKLLSIELNNYRQYIGKQRIDLSSSGKKNFIVVVGANGSGKTNLLNAVTWCLYKKEEHLSKYPSSEKMPIINESVFSGLKGNSITECGVKLAFGEEKIPEFYIERAVGVKKSGRNPVFFNENFQVSVRSDRGWIISPSPDFIVNTRILPFKIRNFFLFDGERLDDFFKVGGNEYIQEAVLDVAQIGLLDRAYSHLNDVLGDYRRLASKESPETEKIVGEIESNIKLKEQLVSRLKEKRKGKTEAEGIVSEIRDYLRDHPVKLVQELQKRHDFLKGEIDRIDDEIKEAREENKDRIITTLPFIYARNAVSKSLKLIEKETQKGKVPPSIRDTFIKELLEEGECICGTDISEDGPHRRKVKSLLNTILPDAVAGRFEEGKYKFANILKKSGSFKDESADYAKELKKLEKEMKKYDSELSEIKTKIGEIDVDEITTKESQRQFYEDQIKNTIAEITSLEDRIHGTEREIDKLKQEFDKKTREVKKLEILNKQIEFCEKSLKLLSEKRQEIIDFIRKEIESRIREYFFKLIWRKTAFKNVEIDSNYNISVTSRYGLPCLGTISAGERQVLALSFMAALYKVSGFNAPVIIDTPLGRISGEPRKNIAKALPEYLTGTQVTLMVTDTEYTEAVRNELIERVSKEYELKFNKPEAVTEVGPYEKQ